MQSQSALSQILKKKKLYVVKGQTPPFYERIKEHPKVDGVYTGLQKN